MNGDGLGGRRYEGGSGTDDSKPGSFAERKYCVGHGKRPSESRKEKAVKALGEHGRFRQISPCV